MCVREREKERKREREKEREREREGGRDGRERERWTNTVNVECRMEQERSGGRPTWIAESMSSLCIPMATLMSMCCGRSTTLPLIFRRYERSRVWEGEVGIYSSNSTMKVLKCKPSA